MGQKTLVWDMRYDPTHNPSCTSEQSTITILRNMSYNCTKPWMMNRVRAEGNEQKLADFCLNESERVIPLLDWFIHDSIS